MTQNLIVATDGHVRQLTLHRPERLNAIDTALLRAMDDAVRDALNDDDVHVILMRGSDRAFSAGADVKSGEPTTNRDGWIRKVASFHHRLLQANKPVVVAVTGYALGLGMSVVACGDFVVGGPESVMGLPEIDHGLVPGIAAASLSRRMSSLAIGDLAMSGRKVYAQELASLNMVDRFADTSVGVEGLADEVAAQLAQQDPAAVQEIKRMIRSFENTAIIDRVDLGCAKIESFRQMRLGRN